MSLPIPASLIREPSDQFRSVWVLLDEPTTTWLINLGGNFRKEAKPAVALLLDEMKNGTFAWPLVPFAVISRDRELIDGNHRLRAYAAYLAAGGTPAVVELRYEAPPEWAHLYDANRVRTTSQRAAAVGLTGSVRGSTGVSALYYLSQSGTLRTSTVPPSFTMQLLGADKEGETIQRIVLEEASRLYGRFRTHLDETSNSAFTSAPALALFSLWLAEDEARARDVIFAMLASTDFAPSKGTVGPAAAMSILRSSLHTTFRGESSTWFRQERMLLILASLWIEPDITYATLERRFLSRDVSRMNARAVEARPRFSPLLQRAATEFIESGVVSRWTVA